MTYEVQELYPMYGKIVIFFATAIPLATAIWYLGRMANDAQRAADLLEEYNDPSEDTNTVQFHSALYSAIQAKGIGKPIREEGNTALRELEATLGITTAEEHPELSDKV